MKIKKILKEKLSSNYAIWRVIFYDKTTDFYDRKTNYSDGLTKEELMEILIKKGQLK